MLTLTPATLAAAYDYLATTAPFNKWNLPDSEDVTFRVVRSRVHLGWYDRPKPKRRHTIFVSAGCIARTDSLLRLMAHEMIHLHEANAKACGRGEHSAAFHAWAAQVCKVHGFDLKLF